MEVLGCLFSNTFILLFRLLQSAGPHSHSHIAGLNQIHEIPFVRTLKCNRCKQDSLDALNVNEVGAKTDLVSGRGNSRSLFIAVRGSQI